MKNWKSQFKEWLKEICPWDNIEDYIVFREPPPKEWKLKKKISMFSQGFDEDAIRIVIYTKNYSYGIKAKETYLGCIAGVRKPRAGESWTRGSDLPDGKFNRETWEKIKNAIIRYEVVKVMKPQEPMADTPK